MEIVVEINNIRIDKYLMEKLDYSRSKIQKMIDNGNILVNDKSWQVRAAVAEQGYGLDKLINDESSVVRSKAAERV